MLLTTKSGKKRIYDGEPKAQVSVQIPIYILQMWDELSKRNGSFNRTLTLRQLIEDKIQKT